MPSEYFPLYYTLNKNLDVKRITQKQINKLSTDLSKCSEKTLNNVILTIYEHAREKGDFDVDSGEIPMVYGLEKVEDEMRYKLNLKEIPPELFLILEKLLKLV